MSEEHRPRALLGILAVLVITAIVVLILSAQPSKPRPSSSTGIYYTGPMRNKSGTAYATEDGRIVPPPPGAAPVNTPGVRGRPIGQAWERDLPAPASGDRGTRRP